MTIGYYNSISGIKSGNFGMDVIANDISNINTVGYKSSNVEFKSLFYDTLNQGNSPVDSQIGFGSTSMAATLNFKQGSLIPTDNVFDMAIEGNGFFGLSGPNSQVYYTRNGDFNRDSNGNMVDKSGKFLLGTMASLSRVTLSQNAAAMADTTTAPTLEPEKSIELNAATEQSKINLPNFLYLPAVATKQISFKGSLDSSIKNEVQTVELDSQKFAKTLNKDLKTINLSASLSSTPKIQNPLKPDVEVLVTIKDINGNSVTQRAKTDKNGDFNLNNVDLTGLDLQSDLDIKATAAINQQVANKQSLSTNIFDLDGSKNNLKLEFQKQVPAAANGAVWNVLASIVSPKNEIISTQNGALSFNEKGALVSNTLNEIDGIKLNLGSIFDKNIPNSGFDGILSLAGQNSGFNIDKDGSPEGILSNYSMNGNGEIIANFDNGKTASIAKVALFHFQNDQGLSKASENTYQSSANSGEPIFYQDSKGKVIYGASIKPSFLEMSNVDLSVSLTELITMQKFYEASAKSISTSDQMIEKAINMKR